jgi:hypothetical protein
VEQNEQAATGKKISRRDAIKLIGKVTGAVILGSLATGCADGSDFSFSSETTPNVLSNLPNLNKLADEGKNKRTEADIKMLNETKPGIDLTYSRNETIKAIRELPFVERVMGMIGYLDVENSGRYNRAVQGIYLCNVYALDLARAVLGNDSIGTRYEKANQRNLRHAGFNDLADPTHPGKGIPQEVLDELNKNYAAFDSNMFDAWMKKDGVYLGWRHATTKQDLIDLKPDELAIGVTSEDQIKNRFVDTGHMFILYKPGESFVLSQATDNIRLLEITSNSSESKISSEQGKYSFWVHKIPSQY